MAKLRGTELMAIAVIHYTDNKNERICMGLFLDTCFKLRWMNSGRLFDLSDIYDHCPCKLYVHFTMALPSRTISDSPQIMTQYTFPRANPKEWDEKLRDNFQKMFDAFAELAEDSRELPWQLVPWESSFVGPDEMDMLKNKWCNSNKMASNEDDKTASTEEVLGSDDEALIVDGADLVVGGGDSEI